MQRPSAFELRSYGPAIRVGRDALLYHCIKHFTDEGYQVYKRGFPTLIAVKDKKMRMVVVNPMVTIGHVILGGGKDAMSEAFEKCFGVSYELWANDKPEEQPKSWI